MTERDERFWQSSCTQKRNAGDVVIGAKYIFEITQNAASEAVRAYFRPLAVSYNRPAFALDKLLASLCLILALPIIVIAALAVKLTSLGPPFYSQTRVGYNGRLFRIYKFRTMAHDATASGVRWSSRGEQRITWIGNILRKTHLDKLPQLINVLKGDMVLIGVRPEKQSPGPQVVSDHSNRLVSPES